MTKDIRPVTTNPKTYVDRKLIERRASRKALGEEITQNFIKTCGLPNPKIKD